MCALVAYLVVQCFLVHTLALDSIQHDVVHVTDTDEQSLLPEIERRRSRSSHHMRCWHCGHTGHIRRRCFRRMRQQRRRCMHVAQTALTVDTEDDSVAEYACDGDVTFASSVPPAYFDGCSLSPC